MVRFIYRGYDLKGRAISGEIEGASREDSFARLRKQGIYPSQLRLAESGHAALPRPSAQSGVFNFGQSGLTAADLLLLTREMAVLSNAAVPLDDALRISVLNSRMSNACKRIVSDVHERIIGGASLGDALGAHPGAFPGFYVRSIGAAERAGKLAETFELLTRTLERRADLARRLRSALTYPGFLLLAACVTLGLVMIVLVPTLSALFEGSGMTLPRPLALLRDIGRLMTSYWMAVVGIMALAALAAQKALKAESMRLALARLVLRLPVVGRITRDSEQVRFADTLSMLLASGVPVLDALQNVAAAQGNPAYRFTVSTFAARIGEGDSLSHLIAGSPLFDELLARLVTIGEQTGTLDTMLGRGAAILSENQRHEVDWLVSLIGPAMTVVVGGVIGLIVISVISALGGLNELAVR